MIVSFQVTRDSFNGNKKIYRILRNARMEYNIGKNEGNMDIFKKHYETFTILGSIATMLVISCMWINSQINDVREEISSMKTDMAVMKTVMIMKDVMPKELASNRETEK